MDSLQRRRRFLQQFTAAAALASCGSPDNANGGEFEEDLRFPWNSPENDAAARRRQPPTHLSDPYFRGPALSPDGSLLAVTLPTSPVNELAIIDLRARTGWVIAHSNYRVKLEHPAFSPDGRSIAVVVTPPTYFGVSEIWIGDPRGGACRVISERPSTCYVLPSFSSDGARLLCFAEADQPMPDEQRSWGRSYRTGLVPFALHEIEIGSRRKVKLAAQAWSSVNFAAYGPDETGFYLSTGRPLVLRSSDGHEQWVRDSDVAGATSDGLDGYYLQRGQEPSSPPRNIIPNVVSSVGDPATAALVGVDGRGRMLVRVATTNERSRFGGSAGLFVIDGNDLVEAVAPLQAFIQEGAISRDGSIAAGRATWSFENGQSVLRPPELHSYFVSGIADGLVELDLPQDIQFEAERRILAAADPSEMAE